MLCRRLVLCRVHFGHIRRSIVCVGCPTIVHGPICANSSLHTTVRWFVGLGRCSAMFASSVVFGRSRLCLGSFGRCLFVSFVSRCGLSVVCLCSAFVALLVVGVVFGLVVVLVVAYAFAFVGVVVVVVVGLLASCL